MPKKNLIEGIELRLSITREISDYLQAMVETGLYGKSVNDAALRVIEQAIPDFLDRAERFKAERERHVVEETANEHVCPR